MTPSSKWPRNRLLAALPSRHLKRLMQELEHIPCQGGEVLIDAEAPLDHVYFPESGVISLVAVYADGSGIETATVGREGCTGVQAIFGAKKIYCTASRPNPRQCYKNAACFVQRG